MLIRKSDVKKSKNEEFIIIANCVKLNRNDAELYCRKYLGYNAKPHPAIEHIIHMFDKIYVDNTNIKCYYSESSDVFMITDLHHKKIYLSNNINVSINKYVTNLSYQSYMLLSRIQYKLHYDLDYIMSSDNPDKHLDLDIIKDIEENPDSDFHPKLTIFTAKKYKEYKE